MTIQDKLSRLSKELYISSDQVTVQQLNGRDSVNVLDGEAGILEEPIGLGGVPDEDADAEISLTSALERLSMTSHEMGRSLDLQRRTAAMHAKELELRASKDTEILAAGNKEHLERIQQFLDSNMDVDLMDIRRNQDLVLSQLEDYQRELDEKTTEDQVDSRIQSRYDELVTHLQIALRSVKDDEANFKACIDRIEATSTDMKATKAERSELKELQSASAQTILENPDKCFFIFQASTIWCATIRSHKGSTGTQSRSTCLTEECSEAG